MGHSVPSFLLPSFLPMTQYYLFYRTHSVNVVYVTFTSDYTPSPNHAHLNLLSFRLPFYLPLLKADEAVARVGTLQDLASIEKVTKNIGTQKHQ